MQTQHTRVARAVMLTLALASSAWMPSCENTGSSSAGGGASNAGGGASNAGGGASNAGGGSSSAGGGSSSAGGGSSSAGGGSSNAGGGSSGAGGGSSGAGGGSSGYELDPPDPCYNQFWVAGCQSGVPSSACGGRCAVANACSPPEDPNKAQLPKTFACPRFMLFSDEMKQAASADAKANGWSEAGESPFTYAVVGHDVDRDGLDQGTSSSTCCQCYQLVFDKPEPGSPQPPELPLPKPMIVQSFNTAAGGGKNFDIFMGAGGFGAFNACVSGSFPGAATTTFGEFLYASFPSDFNGQGGIKFLNLEECKVNGRSTVATLTSASCQGRLAHLCDTASAPSAATTRATRTSCKESNLLASAYHQNWAVRAKKVECPLALTRVTGCRLAPTGLPPPDPGAKRAATADTSFRSGYTTTTMQDCCKPTCAWKDFTSGAGLAPDGRWTSFYSCDQTGAPFTSSTP